VDSKPSRTNLLRYRLALSGVAVGLLVLGAVPWLVLYGVATGTEGGLRVFLMALALFWGFAFFPFLWLGAQALRMAWRPLRIGETLRFAASWPRRRRADRGADRAPAPQDSMGREEVIDAEWRERP